MESLLPTLTFQFGHTMMGCFLPGYVEDVLTLVVGGQTVKEVWLSIEENMLPATKERESWLKDNLFSLKKGSLKLDDFLNKFRGLCDSLAAIGKPLTDDDKTVIGQKNDGKEADPQQAFFGQRGRGKSFQGQGQGRGFNNNLPLFPGQGRGFNNNFRGRGNYPSNNGHNNMNQSFNMNQSPSNNSLPQPRFNNNGPNLPPAPKHYSTEHVDQRKHNSKSGIICQICGKTNHSAAVCRHRYDYFTPEEEAPQALAAMNLQDENDPQLYADSGATAHMDACSVPTTPNVSQWLPTTWTESFNNTSLGHIEVANPNYTATSPNMNEPLSPTPNKVVIIEDLHELPTYLPESSSTNSPQKSPSSNNKTAASADNTHIHTTSEQTLDSDNRAPSALNDLSGKLFVELNISPVKTTESLNTHPMLTRNKLKQNPTLALQTDHATVTEPKTLKSALKHPLWLQAMAEELAALHQNKTWTLVPRPHDANVIGSNPVIKPTTIRLVLALATSSKWLIKQLDVRNAFLHGQLKEIAYMEQPPGFTDQNLPDHVCLLHKSLYGLKQAPRAWFECLSLALLELGFTSCKADPSLFIFHANDILILLLVYVDDVIITGNNPDIIQSIISHLSTRFALKDLGLLSYFLGIENRRFPGGIFLSQANYTRDLLTKAALLDCTPNRTPMAVKTQPYDDDQEPIHATHYRSLVGSLQYLTFTRPDITHAVNKVCQHFQSPTKQDLKAITRILRYLKGTLDFGLRFLEQSSNQLYGFSDFDWAGCLETRRSTTGFCVYLGANLISWCSKKQSIVARSTAEAEYRALSSTTAELTWILSLLQDIGVSLSHIPHLLCDNTSAIYMTRNPVFHARSKHIEIDVHFVREKVSQGLLKATHVPSLQQAAYILTKLLGKDLFFLFRQKLGVHSMTRPTLRGAVKIHCPPNVEFEQSQHMNHMQPHGSRTNMEKISTPTQSHINKASCKPLETNMAICIALAKGLQQSSHTIPSHANSPKKDGQPLFKSIFSSYLSQRLVND
ncbi:retrovirus-related pol polyprotein from transposon RE2 [Citrus sinensis]|uniref:Retrovirus-related pol polyprotein from transposon RE2 n=2 Tax=Citrus sinensis TaxID=2711 RepID=A0ACB8KB47_CITSI|nr:retrovirus-related pol polyprotein from transposon RE2 [Citrus sinensis]